MQEVSNNVLYCPICNSQKGFSVGWNNELLRCTYCQSMVWSHVMANNNQTSPINYKGNDYFGDISPHYLSEEIAHRKDKRKLLRLVLDFMKLDNATIVEIGSAYGFFLDEVKKISSTCHVTGIEPGERAVLYSREQFNLNIYQETIEEALMTRQEIFHNADAIVAWAILEHLPSFYQVVSRLSMSMKEGAFLFFTTIDSRSIVATIRKTQWRLFAPPAHLLYPSKKGLIVGLQRCGFRIEKIQYFGNQRALSQYVRVLGKSMHHYLCKKFPIIFHISFPLNLFDIPFIAAQKIK